MPGPSGLGKDPGRGPKALGNVQHPQEKGCRFTVGLGGSGPGMNSAFVHVREPSATCGRSWTPEEATAAWSADGLQQAPSPGGRSTVPAQDRLLCGGPRPSACPPPGHSQAGFFLRRPADPLHPWVPGMEKLRAGAGVPL